MVPFLPEYITNLLNRLQKNGFKAYVVGGCVRDIYMGKTPHDYDVTTSATPKEITNIFEKTIATGIKHGTVTVIIEGHPVEVTTFRTEGDYSDSRRPDNVTFVRNLEYDLARRDFTVNALAYNPKEGLIDLYGGLCDLQAGILKAVGVPEERFTEDALRILRLFRFAAVLNFQIEENTFNGALKKADTLQKISRERIAVEIEKAVCGNNVNAVLPLLQGNFLSFIGISNCGNIEIISKLPQNTNLRLFAFLHLCGADTQEVSRNLKLSNLKREYLKKMSFLINKQFSSKTDIKNALRESNEILLRDTFTINEIVYGKDIKNSTFLLEEIINNNEPYLTKHLAINGNDLKEIGINGVHAGKVLNSLLDCVVQNKTLNTKEQLLEIAQNHRN